MANKYISRYCALAKTNAYIAAYPDTRYVLNSLEDYNTLYGVNYDFYPAPYPGHKGTDYLFSVGTPLYGLSGFRVESIKDYGSYGLGLALVIGNGVISFTLGHLNEVFVTPGEQTTEDKVIATTGNTGLSQGPHLHVQTFLASLNSWVDSTPYMDSAHCIPGYKKPLIGTPLPQKSLALLNNELVGVIECAEDSGKIVARIIDKILKESIVPTVNLTPQPLYTIGALCINVITNQKCYLIEYGQNDIAKVARVNYIDGTQEVLYAHQLYGIPVFSPGKTITTIDGAHKRVEQSGITPDNKLVYRLSDVYFADRIADII